MIHSFKTARRILFFPKRWANSVVRWMAGIHSPDNSLEIKNTMDPGNDGSLQISVNMKAVKREIAKWIDCRNITTAERERFILLLRGFVDGASVVLRNNSLSIDGDWIGNLIEQYVKDNNIDNQLPALEADKWVKTNADGELSTATETPVNVTGAMNFSNMIEFVSNGANYDVYFTPPAINASGELTFGTRRKLCSVFAGV